jgi:SAM-dependent methyltransferase
MTAGEPGGPVTREAVVWAFRLFFGREPENGAEVDAALSSTIGLRSLRRGFLLSEEFGRRLPPAARIQLTGSEPRLAIEYAPSLEQLTQLFERIQSTWQRLGTDAPFWSVLTSPDFLGEPSEAAVERFFQTSESELVHLVASLNRVGLSLGGRGRCLEYGCGLGRMTRRLQPFFEHIIAADISQPHLERARSLPGDCGAPKIDWRHLRVPADIARLPAVDFIYSMIVLQHNPPPLIDLILSTFARILEPGGIAVFQVPTYRKGYSFLTETYLANPNDEMEMHVLPQHRIFEIFAKAGARPVSVVEDAWTGLPFERSNTFIFLKDPVSAA